MKTIAFLEDEPPPERKTRPPWATKINIPVLTGIVLVHIIGIMIFVMMYFGFVNWINVVIFFVLYCVMGLGITMGFHRYFTHKSFEAVRSLVCALVIAGHLALQGPIFGWVIKHRAHHKDADVKDVEPHTPKNGFWWAHFLWNIYKDPEGKNWMVRVKDLEKDPFLCVISRFFWLPQFILVSILFSTGFLYGGLWRGISWVCTDAAAVMCVYHATWFINSWCHTWGKRDCATDDHSKNSLLIALITFGEGYHNYHHDNQRSARHGRGKFDFDPTYWVIKCLSYVGLTWDIK